MQLPPKVTEFISKHIGVSYTKFDCWQIVAQFYSDVFNRSFGEFVYGDPMNAKNISRVIECEKCNFTETKTPEIGDIILLRIQGCIAHVGIYLSPEKFIHTSATTGCIVDNLVLWKHKIEGFYKWPR